MTTTTTTNNNAKRAVTEADFRMPEFRDAKVEDYEFRDDGKLVRKDRWERGFRSVVSRLQDHGITDVNLRNFEIDDVLEKLGELPDRTVRAEALASVQGAQSVIDGEHSRWTWLRMGNGDVMLATHPWGQTYELNEKEYP